jgi:hypothetical protein
MRVDPECECSSHIRMYQECVCEGMRVYLARFGGNAHIGVGVVLRTPSKGRSLVTTSRRATACVCVFVCVCVCVCV